MLHEVIGRLRPFGFKSRSQEMDTSFEMVLVPPAGHDWVWHHVKLVQDEVMWSCNDWSTAYFYNNNVNQLKTWSSPMFNDTVLETIFSNLRASKKKGGLDTETFLFHSHHLTYSSSTMSTWAWDHQPSKPFWAFTGSNGGFHQQRETVYW